MREFVPVDYEEEGTGVGGYAKVMSEGFQKAQLEMFAKQAQDVDIIITTALIPGKPAPKLITAEMVRSMRPGSVIVDMAAEQGGNCELTVPGEVVVRDGVTIIGYTDLPSRLAEAVLHAVRHQPAAPHRGAVQDQGRRHQRQLRRRSHPRHDSDQGRARSPGRRRPPRVVGRAAAGETCSGRDRAAKEIRHGHGAERARCRARGSPSCSASARCCSGWSARTRRPRSSAHFTVFVLACFIGYMVVWNVTPSLHTPLMSVTNAISSIIAVGALVQVAPPLSASGAGRPDALILGLAVAALALTAINMFGGFAVTRRMLAMFRK